MLKIGSHVGMAGKEMLLGAAKEAASYGATTFMFTRGLHKIHVVNLLKN